ncbi:hypothetical protein Taro_038645 [Colocasia esculenta]|uniref:Peptidase C1A papain C-terminal domain-containing protein n=1 Tax=Colocasia esculenta TaxID=4460 RepID=A0A843WP88_COLES|nr:hypothetical protein [Colocasia esculenta]
MTLPFLYDKLKNREVTIDGYKHVTRNNERLLMKRVARQPVAAHLDAGGLDFQFYMGGIYRGGCTGKENHSVTIVGYDSEAGEDYWIIRNSYGDRWGEGGYMKLPRNVQERRGKCGIAARPMYPIKRWYRPSS